MEYFMYTNDEINEVKNIDEKISEIVNKVGHINREINTNTFEKLICSILAQQISNKAYESVYNKFLNIVSEISSKAILSKTDDELQKAGISYRKVSYIKNVCAEEVSGRIDFKALHNYTNEEIINMLTNINGVGVWTAKMMLIFSLNRKDVLPYEDLIIKKNLMKLYNLEKFTKKDCVMFENKFSPYSSIVTLYLWEIEKFN